MVPSSGGDVYRYVYDRGSKHKRPYVSHRIVYPWLITHLRSKALRKYSYFMLTIPTSLSVWPNTFHEKFSISLILPIIRVSNWKWTWVIKVIQLSGACIELFEGGGSKWKWEGDHLDPLLWEGNCVRRAKTLLTWGVGLFCAIFSAYKEHSHPSWSHDSGHVINPILWIFSQWGGI